MFTARRIYRSAIVCVLACALLAPAAGAAGSPDETRAIAQERYYSSYGPPAPSPAASDGIPWLPIALSGAVVLVAVAASGTQLHRLRIRRRTPRAAV